MHQIEGTALFCKIKIGNGKILPKKGIRYLIYAIIITLICGKIFMLQIGEERKWQKILMQDGRPAET